MTEQSNFIVKIENKLNIAHANSEADKAMIAKRDEEIRELSARLVFIRAVVEKRLTVANASDEDLLAGLVGLELPALSEGVGLKGYEYLLKMRIDRIKAAAVTELEKEVADATAVRDKLAATSIQTLWLADLDEFSAAWKEYTEWRNGTYASAAAATVPKKKAVVKRAAKKA